MRICPFEQGVLILSHLNSACIYFLIRTNNVKNRLYIYIKQSNITYTSRNDTAKKIRSVSYVRVLFCFFSLDLEVFCIITCIYKVMKTKPVLTRLEKTTYDGIMVPEEMN